MEGEMEVKFSVCRETGGETESALPFNSVDDLIPRMAEKDCLILSFTDCTPTVIPQLGGAAGMAVVAPPAIEKPRLHLLLSSGKSMCVKQR